MAGLLGGGEFFDLAARLCHLLHRLLQGQQFVLQLLQSVGRFLEPAGGRAGEERNAVADDGDHGHEENAGGERRADVNFSETAQERFKEIAEENGEDDREQDRAHEIHGVEQRENEEPGEREGADIERFREQIRDAEPGRGLRGRLRFTCRRRNGRGLILDLAVHLLR